MSLLTDLIGLGLPPEQALKLDTQTVSSAVNLSSVGTITAAGTTVADATALTAFVNNVTTVAASTGVKLPDAPIGSIVTVSNAQAVNSLKVYPHSATGTLNGGTAGAGVTSTTAQAIQCVRQSATNWIALVHTKAT
jgi:hypothetical protein